jgi:hypothetical protein
MMGISVIVFYSQSNAAILDWWTKCIADRMALQGMSVETINLMDPDWPSRLKALLTFRLPDFCFSFQGFGMRISNNFSLRVSNDSATRISNDTDNLWNTLSIPFVSSMGDAPYWNPDLHNTSGKMLAHLYASDDFREFYRDIMKGHNFATFVPFGYPANPHADAISWHKRDLDLVFMKSGADPKAHHSSWNELPAVLREVLEEASAIALAGQTEAIGKIVTNVFSARKVDLAEITELLAFCCRKLDAYVRATRAERMVRQIMRHGGHIFGDWPHLDRGKSRAIFHGKIPAKELNKLYARSRILANTAPCVVTGMHERILSAFQAKAFILTDSYPFLEERLASYPSFKSVPIESAEFADILDARLLEIRRLGAEPAATQAMLDDVRVRAEAEFGLDQFISRILEVVSSLRARRGDEIHAK